MISLLDDTMDDSLDLGVSVATLFSKKQITTAADSAAPAPSLCDSPTNTERCDVKVNKGSSILNSDCRHDDRKKETITSRTASKRRCDDNDGDSQCTSTANTRKLPPCSPPQVNYDGGSLSDSTGFDLSSPSAVELLKSKPSVAASANTTSSGVSTRASADAMQPSPKKRPENAALLLPDDSDSDDSLLVFKTKLAAASRRHRHNTVRSICSCSSSDEDEDEESFILCRDRSNDKNKAAKGGTVKPPPSKTRQATTKAVTATLRRTARKTDEERKREVETKMRERLEREQLRKQLRAERAAEKEQEKRVKMQQRERERTAKRLAKEQKAASKRRRREDIGQATGKFAAQEIAVLMERSLVRHGEWKFSEDLVEAGYTTVLEYPSGLGSKCKAVQWIRRAYLEGGAAAAVRNLHTDRNHGNSSNTGDNDYDHLPVLVLVFDDPHKFLAMLERSQHGEDDDYPQLEVWLRGVQAGWRASWRKPHQMNPRILLLVNNAMKALDRKWINYRKQHRQHHLHKSNTNLEATPVAPPTADELNDATTWLLIQFQVECIHCASLEDISHNLCKTTRLLAEEPYQKQMTELECVKKIKAGCTDMDPPDVRSQDCWLRQLQQVPRLSDKMAHNLVRHFPTARSLWLAYQDVDRSEDEKRLLAANLLAVQRSQAKLSHWLYRLMTSHDPNEMLC